MHRSLFVIMALGLALAWTGPVAAQESSPEEMTTYLGWYGANQAKDVDKAAGFAKEYLQRFPTGQYAEYLKKWLVSARGAVFNAALQKKDMAAVVRVGKEVLKDEPNNLTYLYSLALNLRRYELKAKPPKMDHAADAAEFSRRAIELLEAGKTPGGTDPAKWKKEKQLAWLYQNLALVAAKTGDADAALRHYEKSSALDPENPDTATYNAYACGAIRQRKYAAAGKAFNALPEEERRKAEPGEPVQAALKAANDQADEMIRCWTRFLALATANQSYASAVGKIARSLGKTYASRHRDDPEGWRKLIEEQGGNLAELPQAEESSTQ